MEYIFDNISFIFNAQETFNKWVSMFKEELVFNLALGVPLVFSSVKMNPQESELLVRGPSMHVEGSQVPRPLCICFCPRIKVVRRHRIQLVYSTPAAYSAFRSSKVSLSFFYWEP